MYAKSPMSEMIAAIGKSQDAIYSKAKLLKLRRENSRRFGQPGAAIGHKYAKGNVPWNAKPGAWRVPTSKELIAAEFEKNPTQTVHTLSAATGIRAANCGQVCNHMVKRGELHITGWKYGRETRWNRIAVYELGYGQSVEWKNPAAQDNPYEIQPIPAPTLGLWGLCWPITTQGAAGAGKEQAAL